MLNTASALSYVLILDGKQYSMDRGSSSEHCCYHCVIDHPMNVVVMNQNTQEVKKNAI